MTTDWLLLLARILISSVFVLSAIDKFRLVPQEVEAIRALHLPAPAFLELLTGVCESIGCLMLVLGFHARTASILLAVFTVFVTLAFLQFWKFQGSAEAKLAQRNTFFSNLAALGGLIYIGTVGPGALAINNG